MTDHACPRFPEEDFVEVLASWEFPPQAMSVTTARVEAAALLADLEIDHTYEAQVIIDELAANAVVHAKTEFELTIERWQNGLRIIVRDLSRLKPYIQYPDALAESGRGLFMLADVADDWGYHPTEDGKCVWANVFVNF
jgi:anti-sigma regulatory factor (Ser/Thr protein kinase)